MRVAVPWQNMVYICCGASPSHQLAIFAPWRFSQLPGTHFSPSSAIQESIPVRPGTTWPVAVEFTETVGCKPPTTHMAADRLLAHPVELSGHYARTSSVGLPSLMLISLCRSTAHRAKASGDEKSGGNLAVKAFHSDRQLQPYLGMLFVHALYHAGVGSRWL